MLSFVSSDISETDGVVGVNPTFARDALEVFFTSVCCVWMELFVVLNRRTVVWFADNVFDGVAVS